jgi:DNA-binding NarL/FixJ family response regulator
LSVKTVESYRSRLMTKLGLKDRSELTRLALETGLLATEST